jgi:hypothetical protein
MHAPTANDALVVWERGAGQSAAARGLALLGLAHAGTDADTLADVSVGARDAALLALRAAMFGERMESCANCPACREMIEMSFTAADMRAAAPESPKLTLSQDGYDVKLRLLTSRDLLAIEHHEDARAALLARSVVSASANGAETTPQQLPAAIVDAAVQVLADADPQADIQLSLMCPACGHFWKAPFDIVSYLWAELEAWAGRILRDVHVLAVAYGWREADILAMSPARRKFYLDMAAP